MPQHTSDDAQAELVHLSRRYIQIPSAICKSGPGKDSKTLDLVGLTGAGMTADQKALLLLVSEACIGVPKADDAAVMMALITVQPDQTAIR